MMDVRPESSRYQLQRDYQPNMAKGWGVVIILATIFAICVATWDQGEVVRLEVESAGLPSDIRFDPDRVERSSEMAARRSVGGFNPRAQEHQGFLGFNVKIVKDNQPFKIDVEKPPVYSAEMDDELSAGDISFSVTEGEGTGLYIPKDAEYDFLFENQKSANKSAVNRDATLIRSVKPEVPWIAVENKKEGYVEVLVLIDKTGQPVPFACKQADGLDVFPEFVYECRLKDGSRASLEFFVAPQSGENKLLYVVLREEPKEYYFADKLIEKLPQWKFSPAIRDNRPVEQFVIVRFRYCDPNDLDCQAIVLAGASS